MNDLSDRNCNVYKNPVSHEDAANIIRNLAPSETVILRSGPGIGKSELVEQTAASAGLPVKHLYGSQMSAEDIGGIPQIKDGKGKYFPLEDLIPKDGKPFCLFIDEYTICSSDVQKALYSIILDRKVGEYSLPEGTWVILAGNRKEDRALVRNVSSALTNRVLTLDLDLNVNEWIEWAISHSVDDKIVDFIMENPDLLLDIPPVKPEPFSTPRSWTMLSQAMVLLEKAGIQDKDMIAALAFGTLIEATAEKFLQFLFGEGDYHKTLSLSKTKVLLKALGRNLSLMLLSSPGVGKTDVVKQMASEEKLPYVSLLGTQIMAEDVYGIPRVVDDRVHFIPMKMFSPEDGKPICLFLDELPACSPDVQKAFYSLLLDHRAGNYVLPEGSIVVAAGNRIEDQALVRNMSSALVNRTIILQIRPDVDEWVSWAEQNHIRGDIISYVRFHPEALERPIIAPEIPFSSPRSWAKLSIRMNLLGKDLQKEGILHSIVKGCISPEDTEDFIFFVKNLFVDIKPVDHYIKNPQDIPMGNTPIELGKRYFIMEHVRQDVIKCVSLKYKNELVNFLKALSKEDRNSLLVGGVAHWSQSGLEDYLVEITKDMSGLNKYQDQKKNKDGQ